MRRDIVIQGSGGGKSGGGEARVAVEAPNTLRSKQYARVLDLVSEGEIEGLVNGACSIYLDDTPLQNPDGTYNFQDVVVVEQTGTQTQSYTQGFGSIESESAVGVEIKYDTPVVRQIASDNLDAVRVTVSVPQLSSQNTTNGDISGTSVTIAIDVQSNGGGFVAQPTSRVWTAVSMSGLQYTLTQAAYAIGCTVMWKAPLRSSYPDNDLAMVDRATVSYRVDYRKVGAVDWTQYKTGVFRYLQPTGTFQGSTVTGFAALVLAMSGVESKYWKEVIYIDNLPEDLYEIRVVQTGYTGGVGTLQMVEGHKQTRAYTDTISGKTMSKYQRSYTVPLTGTGPWDVRVRRLNADSTSAALNNRTFWDSYTEIVDEKLRYPNSALIGLSVDAAQFSAVPGRGYDLRLLKVLIPDNYDPYTHTYSGEWGGNFAPATWSDNPAWCWYDMLTSERYGLGEFINPAQLNKWEIYEIAKYCDEMVPTGFGGYEPRFTCNLYLQSREDAYKVVNDMASIFRGITYWAAGNVLTVQDAPADPIALFTAANVIDGLFNYSGSALKARHTVAKVGWNDPADNYKQKVEYVEDAEGIERYGVVETDFIAVGCTSRGQAHRIGKWVLYSERMETELVTFTTGINGAGVYPGAIIKTQDSARSGKRHGGRVLFPINEYVLSTDSPVTVEIDKTYTISATMPDGTVEERAILNPTGATSFILPATPFSATPLKGSMWVLAASDLSPELWRVVSIAEKDKTNLNITAVKHHPQKYDFVENDISFEPDSVTSLSLVPRPPTVVSAIDSIYANGSGVSTKITLSWESPGTSDDPDVSASAALIGGYVASYKKGDDNWVELPMTHEQSVDIPNVTDGSTYTLSVHSVNALGVKSPTATEISYTVVGKAWPPSDVVAMYASQELDRVVLSWGAVSDVDLADYEIRRGTVWETATVVGRTNSTLMKLLPMTAGNYTWLIKAVDTTGNYSTNAVSATLSVLAPGAVTLSSTISDGDCVLTWNSPTSGFAISHYEIRTGNDIANTQTVTETDTLSFKTPIDWLGLRTYRVRAIDVAGNVGALSGAAQTAQTLYARPDGTIDGVGYTPYGAATLHECLNEVTPNIATYIYGANDAVTVSLGNISDPGHSLGHELKFGGWASAGWLAISLKENDKVISARYWTGDFPTTPTTQTLTVTPEEAKAIVDYSNLKVELAGLIGTTYFSWVEFSVNGAPLTSDGLIIDHPHAPSLEASLVMAKVQLDWTTPISSLPIKEYEIRYGTTWVDGVSVGKFTGTNVRLAADWIGSRTFMIAAIDQRGNVGAVDSVAVSIAVAAAPVVTAAFNLDQFILNWAAPTSSIPIEEYEVGYGATILGRVKGTTFAQKANWVGSRVFWVRAINLNGNVGLSGSVTANISAPTAPAITQQVVDNNVLLYWAGSTGTLPVETYELRRGPTWNDPSTLLIGKKSGGFTTVFETTAGIFTYWVTGVDSAGNYGTPSSVVANVSQPPDYVLQADYNSDFSGTKSNAALDDAMNLIMPVNSTASWSDHFVNSDGGGSWVSPQDQIDNTPSYPVYIQPGNLTGYYEETKDYGQILAATKVTVTTNATVIAGAPVETCTISTSPTGLAGSWTDYPGATQVYATNFQYIKVRITVTGDSSSVYSISGLNIRLDVKLKNDAGSTIAVSTDTGGTQVNFTVPFLDITSITVTPQGTTIPLIAIYDFVDTPNPTGFKVLLFNTAGVRQSGTVSWSVKGY